MRGRSGWTQIQLRFMFMRITSLGGRLNHGVVVTTTGGISRPTRHVRRAPRARVTNRKKSVLAANRCWLTRRRRSGRMSGTCCGCDVAVEPRAGVEPHQGVALKRSPLFYHFGAYRVPQLVAVTGAFQFSASVVAVIFARPADA